MSNCSYTFQRLWAHGFKEHRKTTGPSDGRKNQPDAYFFEKFGKGEASNLPPKLCTAFLTQYQVVRNFRRDAPQNARTKFFRDVFQAASEWKEDASLADKAQSLNFPQKSAASKVAFFFKPCGWTIYDSRARSAIDAKNFEDFYNILDGYNFIENVKKARKLPILDEKKHLYPERVIDKALFILGGTDNYKNLTGELSTEELAFGETFHDILKDTKLCNKLHDKFGLQK